MGGNYEIILNQIGIIYLCGNCGIHFNFLILQLFSRAISRGTGCDLSVHDFGGNHGFISNQIGIIYFEGNYDFISIFGIIDFEGNYDFISIF